MIISLGGRPGVSCIIPDYFSNERQLAHCNRRPNVGNIIEHLEDILPLDVVFLDLGHVDVEYVPDTSLKERLEFDVVIFSK